MKDNKHPHHDLIVEWAKDTSKVVQGRLDGDWSECFIGNVTNDRAGSYEFRFKPREFTKGHWYPCVYLGGNESTGYPMVFDGKFFNVSFGTHLNYIESDFEYIGESLGEINFG